MTAHAIQGVKTPTHAIQRIKVNRHHGGHLTAHVSCLACPDVTIMVSPTGRAIVSMTADPACRDAAVYVAVRCLDVTPSQALRALDSLDVPVASALALAVQELSR